MGLLDSVERLHGALDYHLARHNLLTANLTQLDTPGYKPLDLERTKEGFSGALNTALAETDSAHLGGGQQGMKASNFRVVEDPTVAAGLDGNGVSVDREAVKIAANHVRYEVLATLTTNELSGLAWAANDGRNG